MSWSSDQGLSRRRWLALAAVGLPAALPGCNLRPLYGSAGDTGAASTVGPDTAAELAAIAVTAPETRLGRILENQLIDDLNPAGLVVPKRYRLDVTLKRTEKALAIQLDDEVTRFDLTLAAFFSLWPMLVPALEGEKAGESGAAAEPTAPPLYRSAVRRVASYNVIREPFATLIAEQDAERRAAVEVSREIHTLLALHFENGGP